MSIIRDLSHREIMGQIERLIEVCLSQARILEICLHRTKDASISEEHFLIKMHRLGALT